MRVHEISQLTVPVKRILPSPAQDTILRVLEHGKNLAENIFAL